MVGSLALTHASDSEDWAFNASSTLWVVEAGSARVRGIFAFVLHGDGVVLVSAWTTSGALLHLQIADRVTERAAGYLRDSAGAAEGFQTTVGPRHRNCNAILMKNSTFPSLWVDPELRAAAAGVLRDGETLTAFIETAVLISQELIGINAGFLRFLNQKNVRKNQKFIQTLFSVFRIMEF